MGQVVHDGHPVLAVIEGDVDRVLCSREEQPLADRVLVHPMDVAEDALRDIPAEIGPGLAIIRGLIDERIAIVHLVQIDRDVARPRIITGRLDVGERSERRQVQDVLGDVCPVLSGVAGDLQLAVVGPGPDAALLDRRFGNGENGAAQFHRQVVVGQASRRPQHIGIIECEVGADDFPASAGVRRPMNELAAYVDCVVVMRRNSDRERPLETVLERSAHVSVGRLRPDFGRDDVTIPGVDSLEVGSRSFRPR